MTAPPITPSSKVKKSAEGIVQHPVPTTQNSTTQVTEIITAALAASEKKDYDRAIALCRQALHLAPNDLNAHIHLGIFLREARQPEAALLAYQNFLQLVPHHVNTWIDMGLVNRQLHRFDDAHRCYEHALTLKPDALSALNNRANLLMMQSRIDEAIAQYDQVIGFMLPIIPRTGPFTFASGRYELPQHDTEPPQSFTHEHIAAAYFQKALALLHSGKNETGFTHYEYRWQHAQIKHTPTFSEIPRWQRDQALHNRHLLIFGEQGLGDVLQFLRFLPAVKQAHPNIRAITLVVHEPLVRLLRHQDWITDLCVAIEPMSAQLKIKADCACPLLSLPYLLGIFNDAQYANSIPLFAPPTHPALFDVPSKKIVPRIGIMWAGNRSGDYLSNRSLTLNHLSPVFTMGAQLGAQFFSLVKEPSESEINTLPTIKDCVDVHHQLPDLAATASLIAGMDIVITVDTAIAHLALLMRKPTWLLLWQGADWRWRMLNQKNIWYPHARIIRQENAGDWSPVIEKLCKELAHYFATQDHAKDLLALLSSEGRALQHQKNWQKSVPLFQEILWQDPLNLTALHSLAISLCYSDAVLQRRCEGIALLGFILQIQPQWHDARFNLAIILTEFKQVAAAIALYRQLIRDQPDNLSYYINLGSLAEQAHNTDIAHECARQLIARSPKSSGGYVLMAQACLKNSPDIAERYARLAVTIDPDDPAHQNRLVLTLKENLKWDEGRKVLHTLLNAHPQHSPALNTQGQFNLYEQHYNQAVLDFEQAAQFESGISREINLPQYHYNLSFALLGLRRYEQAWPYFEARWNTSREEQVRHDLPGRDWRGEHPLGANMPLLIHGEQGLGDQLQFLRFVCIVAERYPTAPLWLEVHPYLSNLLAEQPWIRARGIEIFGRDLQQLQVSQKGNFFKCPLLSLPYALKINAQDLQQTTINPYLQAHPLRIALWRKRLQESWTASSDAATKRIGIFYSGTQQSAIRRLRSLPLATLLPLIEALPNIQWVILQPEVSVQEKQILQKLPQVFQHDLNDFCDTAALVSLVDEVITIDSVLAHLSGAMKHKTSVLLPSAADWRWQGESRNKTPWYPHANLLWQEQRGDWSNVIRNLTKQMTKQVTQQATQQATKKIN